MRSRERKKAHPIFSIRVSGTLLGLSLLATTRLIVSRMRRIVVKGESMLPTLRPGDELLVLRWRSLVRPGRIIVYRDRFDEALRVKRLVTRDDETSTVTVTGDNTVLSTPAAELGPVPLDRLEGVVLLVRYAGGWPRRLRYAAQR